MAVLKNLCCYCGSSNSVDPSYFEIAADLGHQAAKRGVGIVYGGGGVGLMGAVANGAMAEDGRVIGIIPEHIEKWELGLKDITEYLVVENMHVRKSLMFERSDAFCALPGGIGTLEEAFEALTWRQLGIHDKPILFLNHKGFWNPLLALFEHMLAERFMKPPLDSLFSVAGTVEEVFALIEAAPEPRRPDDLEQI